MQPGTTHYLRARPTIPDPAHVSFLLQLDPCTPPACPHTWTIGGRPLTPSQLEMAHRITLADADHAREQLELTDEQRLPSGIIGHDADGYPIIVVPDNDPPAA